MTYLIPFLNAAFGWLLISSLFYFLFHPHEKKNFFVFQMQGFIPKNISSWGKQIGKYVAENVVNIPKMKESLLSGDRLGQIHSMLESKVDDFLRNKLKEKIPVFSMFITEGMISKMKEVLMNELENMVPAVIGQIAESVEKQFNIEKVIDEKLKEFSPAEIERIFYQQAGKGILLLKLFAASIGFILGGLEVVLISI